MANTVQVKITISGADPGPYNIFIIDDVDNITAGPTNISKQTLAAYPGYILSVPVGTAKVRVQSVNTGCSTYYLDLIVPPDSPTQLTCSILDDPNNPTSINRKMFDDLYDHVGPYQTNPDRFTTELVLNSYIVNGVQYATGQTLKVVSIAPIPSGFEIVRFGLCYDGVTICPTNTTDWMNGIGAPGIHFYDNMGIIKVDNASTTYYINVTNASTEYEISSTSGFLYNDRPYGTKVCI